MLTNQSETTVIYLWKMHFKCSPSHNKNCVSLWKIPITGKDYIALLMMLLSMHIIDKDN